jgi:hypothetical protein
MLERIQFLAEKGLTLTMVLHDILSNRITHLQECTRTPWMYTGENDTTSLECGSGTDMDTGALATTLLKLSTDPSSTDFVTPPVHCITICTNQAMRSLLLNVMPMLDDIDIAMWQRGDLSHTM